MKTVVWISLLSVLLPLPSSAQSQSQRRLAIPSYASPTGAEWNTWQSLGAKAVGIMIVNLNNGDDTAPNAAVAAAVKRTQDSGILVLGYIHTGYAQRDPADVRAKIDGVVENYKVDGIFLDETPADCLASGKYAPSNGAYYEALTSYIRSKPGKHITVMNPGTVPPEDCWMKYADILLTFEEATLANYQQHYVDREWIHRYPPERFWHLVYSVPSAGEMQQVVKLAEQRGVGWLYVTDDGPDKNPWDDPATYLADEAKAWTDIEPAVNPSSSAAKRVFIQWSGLKGARTQILLDVDRNANTGYRGIATSLGAELMLEMAGDGSCNLMRYDGTGQDWTWKPVAAHVVLTQPEPGKFRVDFDAAPLGTATTIKIQFRSLDQDWNVISASKVFDWNP